MKTNENRSAFVAHESMEAAAASLSLADNRDPWAIPSRCKRPALKPAPRPPLFARLLSLLGFK